LRHGYLESVLVGGSAGAEPGPEFERRLLSTFSSALVMPVLLLGARLSASASRR
jgi:hypothetical protein